MAVRKVSSEVRVLAGVGLFFLLAGSALLWGVPTYAAWIRSMRGKGMLMQAEYEKQIAVEQAKAEVEAAKLRADAIQIVGEASKNYPEYRTQEFIGAFAEAMKSGTIQKIIYVPTEANIPIVDHPRR